MALPTLDAVFASAADQPRRYVLSQWLVGEKEEIGSSNFLVSGLDAEYNGIYVYDGDINGRPSYRLNEETTTEWLGVWSIKSAGLDASSASDVPYPWLAANWYGDLDLSNLVVAEIPAANPIANYLTLPERHLWAKIAVAAGAPKDEAFYINAPKQYAWSDIYNAVAGLIPPSSVLVSGAGSAGFDGVYTERGESGGKPYYVLVGEDDSDVFSIKWINNEWRIQPTDDFYISTENTEFPWQVTEWTVNGGESPAPTVTEIPQTGPNHTDWTEKQALGNIAAAYRGDTGNPANLATYIDWPWRYQVASIITAL